MVEEKSTIKEDVQVQQNTKRRRKPIERYGIANLCILDNLESSDEDLTYKAAMNVPDKEQWRQAMTDELKAFDDNQALKFVDRMEAESVVQCKWVFKKKYERDNSKRYRARLVAKGFTQ